MKKNSENAKFGWKKIRIKWNLDLCNRNICVLLEHQSKGKKSIYLAATDFKPTNLKLLTVTNFPKWQEHNQTIGRITNGQSLL